MPGGFIGGQFKAKRHDREYNILGFKNLGQDQSLQDKALHEPGLHDMNAENTLANVFGNHAMLSQQEMLALQTAIYRGAAVQNSMGIRGPGTPQGRRENDEQLRANMRMAVTTQNIYGITADSMLADLHELNDQDIQALNDLLDSLRAERDALQVEYDDLGARNDVLAQEIQNADEQIALLESDSLAAGEQMNALSLQIGETQTEFDQANQDNITLLEERNAAESEQAAAQENADAAIQRMNENSVSVFGANIPYNPADVIRVGIAQGANLVAYQKLNGIDEQLEDNRARLDELNEELDEYNQEMDELQAEQAQLEEQMALYETDKDKYAAEIEANRARQAEISTDIASLNVRIVDAEQARELRYETRDYMNSDEYQARLEALEKGELTAEEFMNGNGGDYEALPAQVQDLVKKQNPEVFGDIEPRPGATLTADASQNTAAPASADTQETSATAADGQNSFNGQTTMADFKMAAIGNTPQPEIETPRPQSDLHNQNQPHLGTPMMS